MQNLQEIEEHLENISEELSEIRKITLDLKTVDKLKAERAWGDPDGGIQTNFQRMEGSNRFRGNPKPERKGMVAVFIMGCVSITLIKW